MPLLQTTARQTTFRRVASTLLQASPAALLTGAVSVAFSIRMILVALIYRGLADSSPHFGGFGWEMGWVGGSIASGHGFSSPFWPQTGATALVPPGFPFLLASIFRIFGVYTLQAGLAILTLDSLFSALTCIPVYFMAKTVANPRIARFATCAWVVYPFSVYFSTVVWEWSLTALLFSTALAILLRLHTVHRVSIWIGFGLLYGLTALVNPSVLTVLPPLLLLVIWRRYRAALPWRRHTLLAASATLAVVLPWVVYASTAMGTFVPIRDNFWLEFYSGNSGDSFESNVAWTHPASNPVEMIRYQQMGETSYLAEKRSLAKDFVSQHPLWFAIATVRRFVRYWTGFWSFGPRYLHKEPLDVPNLFFCSAVSFWMLRGLRRLWHYRRSAAVPLAVLLIVFPLTYYVTHASMDYRQPIEPVVVVLATIGVLGIVDRPQHLLNPGSGVELAQEERLETLT